MEATLACPLCDKEGVTNPLRQSSRGFQCSRQHIFNDSEELLSMGKLKTLSSTNMPRVREGMSEFRTALPIKLIDALRSKFGDKLAGVAEVTLQAVLDEGSFLVSGFDASRIAKMFGQAVKSASSLVGLIYAATEDNKALKKENDSLRASGPQAPANSVSGDFVQVSLRLPLDDFMTIKGKAQGNSLDAPAYIQQVIKHALDNSWF